MFCLTVNRKSKTKASEFRDKLVELAHIIDCCERMSHKLKTESQLRKKSLSTKVTPIDADEDLFGRLSSAVCKPEADTQKVVEKVNLMFV